MPGIGESLDAMFPDAQTVSERELLFARKLREIEEKEPNKAVSAAEALLTAEEALVAASQARTQAELTFREEIASVPTDELQATASDPNVAAAWQLITTGIGPNNQ